VLTVSQGIPISRNQPENSVFLESPEGLRVCGVNGKSWFPDAPKTRLQVSRCTRNYGFPVLPGTQSSLSHPERRFPSGLAESHRIPPSQITRNSVFSESRRFPNSGVTRRIMGSRNHSEDSGFAKSTENPAYPLHPELQVPSVARKFAFLDSPENSGSRSRANSEFPESSGTPVCRSHTQHRAPESP